MNLPDYTEITDALKADSIHVESGLRRATARADIEYTLFPVQEQPGDGDNVIRCQFSVITKISSRGRDDGMQKIFLARQRLMIAMPTGTSSFSQIEWTQGRILSEDNQYWFYEDAFTANYSNWGEFDAAEFEELIITHDNPPM